MDTAGRVWSQDYGFNTGNAYTTSNAIAGTQDDLLYQSERWDDPSAPELSYAIDVPNGDYTLNLHFADIYSGTFGTGLRVFDVLVEGQLALDDLDIFSEVGGNAALVKRVPATVSDGQLNIEFLHGVENPKISAIEVLEVLP